MRRPRPKLIKFTKSKIPDDSQFIETLVWVLDNARNGKIRGYALIYVVDKDGCQRTIEAAKQFEDLDKMTVLGAIRRLEHNYVRREWPEDFMVDKGTS